MSGWVGGVGWGAEVWEPGRVWYITVGAIAVSDCCGGAPEVHIVLHPAGERGRGKHGTRADMQGSMQRQACWESREKPCKLGHGLGCFTCVC